MQQAANWDEPWLANQTVLEVVAELDRACAMAIVRQVRRSARESLGSVVVDLNGVRGVSFAGLAFLLDRARNAGVLPKISFRVQDPLLRRFFANVRDVALERPN
jgi:ABC-type transporter Mla MlaB component